MQDDSTQLQLIEELRRGERFAQMRGMVALIAGSFFVSYISLSFAEQPLAISGYMRTYQIVPVIALAVAWTMYLSVRLSSFFSFSREDQAVSSTHYSPPFRRMEIQYFIMIEVLVTVAFSMDLGLLALMQIDLSPLR